MGWESCPSFFYVSICLKKSFGLEKNSLFYLPDSSLSRNDFLIIFVNNEEKNLDLDDKFNIEHLKY